MCGQYKSRTRPSHAKTGGRRDQAAEVVEPRLEPAAEKSRREKPGDDGMAGFIGWRVGGHTFKSSFPLYGNGLHKPLDSGLRRNDEMLVETAVVISACSRQAAMMVKTKVAGMRLSFRRHLWTGSPVCGERAGSP